MNEILAKLDMWNSNLSREVSVEDLFTRSETAHKWQATYRSVSVRALTLWRVEDLLRQAMVLQNMKHVLGARILIRSAYETLAILIFMNNRMDAVIKGNISFFKFAEITSKLLLGSKLIEENHDPVNVMDTIRRSDKKYPGILKAFDSLSESAHPNFDGMSMGYSQGFKDEYTTKFSNRWDELFSESNTRLAEVCVGIFEHEHDKVFVKSMEALESWLEEHDEALEAERDNI